MHQLEAEHAAKVVAFSDRDGKLQELSDERKENLRLLSDHNVRLVALKGTPPRTTLPLVKASPRIEELQRLKESNAALEQTKSKLEKQIREEETEKMVLEVWPCTVHARSPNNHSSQPQGC